MPSSIHMSKNDSEAWPQIPRELFDTLINSALRQSSDGLAISGRGGQNLASASFTKN